jgi:hypothetical protein
MLMAIYQSILEQNKLSGPVEEENISYAISIKTLIYNVLQQNKKRTG